MGEAPLTPRPSCAVSDSTNSSENMYTIMNPIGPGAGRSNVSRAGGGGAGGGWLGAGSRWPEAQAVSLPAVPSWPWSGGPHGRHERDGASPRERIPG